MATSRNPPWGGVYGLAGQQSVGSIQDIYSCSDAHSGMLEVYTSEYRGNLIFALECTDEAIIGPEQVVKKQYLHVLLKGASPTVVLLPPGEDALEVLKALPTTSWEKGSPPHRLIVGQDRAGQVLFRLETSSALIDAMSVPILLNDLALALRGQLPPDVATPYSEYLACLQTWPKEETVEYWKGALAGAHPCRLPRRPSAEEAGSHLAPLSLTSQAYESLAWALVLQHYTQSADVCFGSIVSGRDIPLPHIWQMVGPFFNILPCRMVLDGDVDDGAPRTVLDVLRANQMSIQRRNDDHHYSVPEVVRQAGLAIHGDQQLFNTVLTVQPQFEPSTSATGIGFILLEIDDATEYDMCLAAVLSPGCIELEPGYWSSTCLDAYVSEILDRFCGAVGWIVDHPGDAITAVAF
ncbi:CoA-dependent acyltransferase [Aspergillus uvarum CBS 121591]|uniref:CoA-dependent acyltransferase n=1 Tax=Aspergillus uvarum CBS 121591 TaxID=1448315 RepID=A0A319CPS7_9EURO|nr:CoA-dependent acyltransferase [Aspergillus uvarum CBS 121591]PYH86429.1 CoA-dependent acyltransferase [Aspergillus uvarum CBS 121591]